MQSWASVQHDRGRMAVSGRGEGWSGMELMAQAPGLVGARARARGHRWRRPAEAESRRVQTAPRAETESAPVTSRELEQRKLEELWDRHGESAYALACALLG